MITPTTPATGSMVGNHAGLETTSATTTIVVGLQVVQVARVFHCCDTEQGDTIIALCM